LRVFLRRGFHGASLDEIADEAGYTTGAVYSNFKGKDDLFLAVLDAEAQRQLPHHVELLSEARSLEDGLRASARELASYPIDHPGWTGIYVEFWTHASRRPELRRKVAEQYERLLDTVGALVEEWRGAGTSSEAAVAAAARQGQAGMDILEDLAVVEVVDEHDRPVPPGVPGHKVLLTVTPGPGDRPRPRPRGQAQAGPQRARAVVLTGLRPG
jgi:AcrR family transcriptional regulator